MVNTAGVIFYRFGSERGIWREIKLDCPGGILVSDLKILIAQETSLSKDFTRKTNLLISLYDENAAETAKALNDNVVVHIGSRVVINRVAWTPVKPIYHEAKTQFETEIVEEKKSLRSLPISLICRLCGLPMNSPVLVKCSANCGSSGCRACVVSCFKDSIVKPEDGSDAVVYMLSERKSCPFCTRGYVSAFVTNRQMEALLLELDLSNFEIPSLNTLTDEAPKEQHAMAHEDDVVNPKHFLVCIDNALIEVMRESMLFPGYLDSRILPGSAINNADGVNSSRSTPATGDVFVIVVSYVGGGTSISPMGMVRVLEEVDYNMEFLKLTRAHTAFRFEWVHNNTQPLMVPARRQPLFLYLGAKRYTSVALNTDHDVMWRYRNDIMIEVGLKREAFEGLFHAIFGVESDALQKDSDMIYKDWLEAAFPNGPTPMYITQKCKVLAQNEITDDDVFDSGNPYLGYIAFLPFLSQSQFLKIRDTQRRAKEQCLQQLTKRVTGDLPKDKGEPVLERAYNNVWNRHIEYDIPALEESSDVQAE